MTKEELLKRLFAVETALCNARAEIETLASDCHDAWLGAENEDDEAFWDGCEIALQSRADTIAEVEDWLFQIKEGNTTIEDAISE